MSRILLIIDGMTDPEFREEDLPGLHSMTRLGNRDFVQGDMVDSFHCILHILGMGEIPPHKRALAEAYGLGISVCEDDLLLRASSYVLDARGRLKGQAGFGNLLSFPSNPPGMQAFSLGPAQWIFRLPHGRGREGKLCLRQPFVEKDRDPSAYLSLDGGALASFFRALRSKERCMIPWEYSVPGPFPRPSEERAVLGAEPIVRGMARLLHWPFFRKATMTGDTDTDLPQILRTALRLANCYPRLLVHVNGADMAAHRLDALEKRRFLVKVDSELIQGLLASTHELVVTADHGSDPHSGRHIGSPQPVWMRKERAKE